MSRFYLKNRKIVKEGETLTKQDLIKIVAKLSGTTQSYAKDIVNNVLFGLTTIIKEMRAGDRLEIRDFGVFEMSYNKAGTNFHDPRTMEKVIKPAKRRVVWQPSMNIKEELKKVFI